MVPADGAEKSAVEMRGITMSQEPFSTRLASLVQRARQAARLYASIERSASGAESPNEEKSSQAREWRVSNEILLNRIAHLMGSRPVTAVAPREVAGILHQFEGEAVEWSSELSGGQTQLVEHASAADYIATARLARDLVSLKARSQAATAIVHELKTLLAPHVSRAIISSPLPGQTGNGAVPQSAVSQSAVTSPSPSQPPHGDHRFLAQRIRATMAGEAIRPTVDSDSGERAEKKVVPLRRITGER